MSTKQIPDKTEQQTFYVTAYLFTKGLIEAQGTTYQGYTAQYVAHGQYVDKRGVAQKLQLMTIGRDAFAKKEDALKRAEILVNRKLAALEKQRGAVKRTAKELGVKVDALQSMELGQHIVLT